MCQISRFEAAKRGSKSLPAHQPNVFNNFWLQVKNCKTETSWKVTTNSSWMVILWLPKYSHIKLPKMNLPYTRGKLMNGWMTEWWIKVYIKLRHPSKRGHTYDGNHLILPNTIWMQWTLVKLSASPFLSSLQKLLDQLFCFSKCTCVLFFHDRMCCCSESNSKIPHTLKWLLKCLLITCVKMIGDAMR